MLDTRMRMLHRLINALPLRVEYFIRHDKLYVHYSDLHDVYEALIQLEWGADLDCSDLRLAGVVPVDRLPMTVNR